ncbi:kynureninase [Adhaeribacter soli]|uniref:Kynureninase n=1 Tax=Adhaeribacter soli TaxID=2607655 RepID=A0A5N1ISE9_9BACT|nr:kynureninase [Adhaeribacter soli]KAA9331883.1 kynureninase [Adhaeribacter soli]
MTYENTLSYAQAQDQQDPLRKYREQFYFPQVNGRDAVYFTGNSLGLQPKAAKAAIELELEDWANLGVEGHFEGRNPWMHYHEFLTEKAARVVGANPLEVVVMNTLTVNLHLMMVSFYRPTKERFKIITEAGAFPSDQYALETQVKFHGFIPDEAIIEIAPREGEHTLRTEDIINVINANAGSVALIMMGGVNYYTGQAFDMETITKAGHVIGATVGFDLAHAAGNLELHLHDWNVDFAVWCTYKYLNSGPGGTSGVFVHERHADNADLPRFAGWWGHDKEVRFKMQKGFKPMRGAAGWQISNAQILPMAVHNASLKIFDEVGMKALRQKSEKLTGYLEFLINNINSEGKTQSFEMITPTNPKDRGAQISLVATHNGRGLFEKLTKAGVIADWREPNVIRVAPVPLYNSFEDVFRFAEILRENV